jgi:bacterioferritin (cytochrome b1)
MGQFDTGIPGTPTPQNFAIGSDDREKVIDQLNKLLRGELAAVETYRIALDKMPGFSGIQTLYSNMASHKDRVTTIRRYVQELGGEPTVDSGAWGTFAKLIENGAALFGENAAIAALEEGEDKGVGDYRDVKDLEPSVARFVSTKLMSAQLTTHSAMSVLKRNRN